MTDRMEIKGYPEIIGQAALAMFHTEFSDQQGRARNQAELTAYRHAAKILLMTNGQDEGHTYQDVHAEYDKLWAAHKATL